MEIAEHTPPFYSPVKEIIFPKTTYPEIGCKVSDDVQAVEYQLCSWEPDPSVIPADKFPDWYERLSTVFYGDAAYLAEILPRHLRMGAVLEKLDHPYGWLYGDHFLDMYPDALKNVATLIRLPGDHKTAGICTKFIDIAVSTAGRHNYTLFLKNALRQATQEEIDRTVKIQTLLENDGVLDLSYLDEAIKPIMQYKL